MRLTRKQYDGMVNTYPNFMRKEYLTLTRKWSLDGVLVGGNYKTIGELAELLNLVEID